MHKGQKEKRETTLKINVVPQEPALTLTEVIVHGSLAQDGNKDDEAIPRSSFQSMMPRGASGFRSSQRLMEEITIPPMLKFVNLEKDMANCNIPN